MAIQSRNLLCSTPCVAISRPVVVKQQKAALIHTLRGVLLIFLARLLLRALGIIVILRNTRMSAYHHIRSNFSRRFLRVRTCFLHVNGVAQDVQPVKPAPPTEIQELALPRI